MAAGAIFDGSSESKVIKNQWINLDLLINARAQNLECRRKGGYERK